MSNRKKIKNRPKKQTPPAPVTRPRVLLTEANKHEVAAMLGYTMKSVDEVLQKAKLKGYSSVSFPIPPRR